MGWRDFQFTSSLDKEDKEDKVQAVGSSLTPSSTLSLLSDPICRPANWRPITALQADKLIKKYPDSHELWGRFWQHMSDQCDQGAPYEYVLGCYTILEIIWQTRISQRANNK